MDILQIGMSAWIIQDGNYHDFSVNEELSFALEFYPHLLSPAEDEAPTFSMIGPALYSIHGQIAFAHSEAWVTDFGLKAYRDAPLPSELQSANWVKGDVYLGVDPFFYFESLKKLPGIPSITYKWRLRSIKLETTPWLQKDKVRVRDFTKTLLQNIKKTDAWHDDGGHGHYILECECLGLSS